MSELLDRVDRQIHNMEIIFQNNLNYYNKYLKEQHETLIQIKKDLEESEK